MCNGGCDSIRNDIDIDIEKEDEDEDGECECEERIAGRGDEREVLEEEKLHWE